MLEAQLPIAQAYLVAEFGYRRDGLRTGQVGLVLLWRRYLSRVDCPHQHERRTRANRLALHFPSLSTVAGRIP